jgi:NADPH2:quinone reductase
MSEAIQLETTGGPEVLQLVEREVPAPGSGEIAVEVAAAGVNFIDTYHRTGLYPMPLPLIPGQEGAGTVTQVGPDVEGFAVGDRVAWPGTTGSYASHHVVPAAAVVRVPDGVDMELAAAVMLQGMTAHYLLVSTRPIEAGERCLIHAAAGGTGRLLVQIAKMRGAEVVATAGSPEKVELARSAGADHVVDYSETDLVEGVEAAVGQNAIDVIYDGVGAAVFDAGMELLAVRGWIVTFGNASGPVPPIAPLALTPKSLFLTRPKLGDYIATREDLEWRTSELFGWMASGDLDVRVGLRLPLSEAAEAHRRLEGRETTGKVLLIP